MSRSLWLSPAARDALYQSIAEGSRTVIEYWAMLLLAALIALLGLLQNSAPVIIGAMLISPLMDPILAAGLAVIQGDSRLGRKSGKTLVASMIAVVLVTTVACALSPLKQTTPEILARTNPNLLDLFIAIFSGLAGTLALRSGAAGWTIVPGVAIAVAVLPPLAVVGYGLSSQQLGLARGAFVLFVTNLVAIVVSAALVFRLFGFSPHDVTREGQLKFRYRLAISIAVLIVLAIPLLQTLRRSVTQIRVRSEVSRVLDRTFKTQSSLVSNFTVMESKQELRIRATVQTTQYFDSSAIESATRDLREAFGRRAKLDVDQILVAHGPMSLQAAARLRDFISGGMVHAPAPEPPFSFRSNQEKLLAYLHTQIDEVLAGSPILRADAVRAEVGDQRGLVLFLTVTTPEPLEPQTIKVIASQLTSRVSHPVELRGRADLTSSAYYAAFDGLNPATRLPLPQRQAISRILSFIRSKADLHVVVTLASRSLHRQQIEASPIWREVKNLLSGSLPNASYSLEAVSERAAATDEHGSPMPYTPTPGPPDEPAGAKTLRLELRVYQLF